MRRIEAPSQSREECLRRAREYAWLAQNSPREQAAAYAWDQARLWRSLALVARPAAFAGEKPWSE